MKPLYLCLHLLAVQVWLCQLVVVTCSLSSQLNSQGRSLVLVGGGLHENNTEVYNTIVSMAGGAGQARIGIVTSSSADPDDSYQYYRNLFLNRYGAAFTFHVNVSIFNHSVAFDPAVTSALSTLTGFFFSGGDQSRTIQSMFSAGREDSPVLGAIRRQFLAGAVVAGSSAGSACMPASVMVTGGRSYEALKNGAHTTSSGLDDLTYDPQGGLAFLQGYVIDTHFANRGREGRMIRLLSDTKAEVRGVPHGIGIDENTALVITHVGTSQASAQVIGEQGVSFFDLTVALVDTSQHFFTVSDVYMTYLTHGDVYKLHTHDVMFASDKTPLKGNELYSHALTTNDIFGGRSSSSTSKAEFVRVATSVFDARQDTSSFGKTREKHPQFRIEMSKVGRTAVGYVKRESGFHSDRHSYHNMYVRIHA